MHRYIIKRLLFLIPTVLGVTLIIYIVMNITPGNPGRMILGPNATAAEVEAMNDELGYNDPVLVRWFNYLKNIITEGDFGESYSTKLNVLDELWPRFLITLGIILVNVTLNVSSLVIYQSTLSFIGLSLPAPAPEWGSMLSSARVDMLRAPTLVLFPALAIVLTAFSVNLLGDGLRDAMDPRLKN